MIVTISPESIDLNIVIIELVLNLP
jgi:hypothetical protein